MITMVDEEIGRILDALDAAGLTDDTLIIFTSDHGEMLTDHGLLLKGPALYEGAVRVPLVLHWPRALPAGAHRTALASLVDLPATILHAAGRAESSWNQGVSLLPAAVAGDERWTREWALCQYRDSGRPDSPPTFATMLRHRDFKLVVFHGAPATARVREYQLFDLSADPGERQNLAGNPAYQALLLDLLGKLDDVLVAIEDRSAERVAPW
jgi:arylsulfatase A-like enzyme